MPLTDLFRFERLNRRAALAALATFVAALALPAHVRSQTQAPFDIVELMRTLAQVKAGTLRAAVTLPAGFGAKAGNALFGGADKPQIVLHYDPSQSMVLPLVRGLLAQHVMENVSQSMLSAASPMMKDMREQVLKIIFADEEVAHHG